ncbi:MAG: SMP-30/gluconolactonase/LRE family protein [Caulobacteraceae bacterium]|nr:SMP-30/gluconolactonase/LRE family protein [Caulobacteraceae bacterium]
MEFELLTQGYGLVEGPRVDAQGRLFFSCSRTGVYRRDPDGAISHLFERPWVGGIALNRGGGLLVTGGALAVWDGPNRTLRDVFAQAEGKPLPGLNDLTVDDAGNVFVGVMGFDINVFDPSQGKPPPGSLYRVSPSGEAVKLWDNVMVPNGIGFSPDGALLYQSDTMTHAVWVYDVTPDKMVRDRRVFCRFADDELPDGIAIDIEGGVWVAVARGKGEVVRIRPDGAIDRRIKIPSNFVTSLTFGGADLTELYVVTADNTITEDGKGAVFRARADVPGLLTPEAQF